MEENKIILEIPTMKTLYFKKEIKEDPKTMDYNAGYDLCFEGYNKEDGTIKTSIKELKEIWSKKWIGNEPNNFYYFIKYNNILVGEVYAKYDNEYSSHEIGVVIKHEYRGKGIATYAIKLLCEILKEKGIITLHHIIPISRKSAIQADIKNGFNIIKNNIKGIKKWGKVEQCVYLERQL